MYQNKYDLFDIKKVVNIMQEKQLSNNYILFKAQIPHINNYGKINVQSGNSFPNPVYSNYFLSFGILHEFLQEYNSTNVNTFKYFTRNILERKELSIKVLSEKISKEENINLNDIKTFDYSHKSFFSNNEHFSKGSYIKNITYCYNNNNMPVRILDIFLMDKVSKNDKLLIKLPSIISKVALDVIKLLSYIFKNVTIFKNIHDSYFKDSFHIFVESIILDRYYEIQQTIKKTDVIKSNNRAGEKTFRDNPFLKHILELDYNDCFNSYNNIIKEFTNCIEITIFGFLLSLQKALNDDKKQTYRKHENWKLLDYYNNFLNNEPQNEGRVTIR